MGLQSWSASPDIVRPRAIRGGMTFGTFPTVLFAASQFPYTRTVITAFRRSSILAASSRCILLHCYALRESRWGPWSRIAGTSKKTTSSWRNVSWRCAYGDLGHIPGHWVSIRVGGQLDGRERQGCYLYRSLDLNEVMNIQCRSNSIQLVFS